jgi:hypothetical protein
MIAEREAQVLRLFAPFLDATDMVGCWPADTTLSQINRDAAELNLRFPLVCNPAASLRDNISAVEYTSHSARFGPYVDNVLGMNWKLRSGTVVRVGERVIKSATGYDLPRFLLHSDGRYGRPANYVLRLRPIGGEIFRATLRGDNASLERARSMLLKSPWIHWFDALDLLISTGNDTLLELTADCALGEGTLFHGFTREFSRESGVQLVSDTRVPTTVLPSLSLKTIVGAASGLARQLVRDHGGSARVLCVSGVVHYFPPAELRSLPESSLAALERQCIAEGGHLSGPWAMPMTPSATETAWAEQLEAAWNQL